MSDPIKAINADEDTSSGGSRARLDIFWPILAVVLVSAVIFVASVAHHSMNGVGVLTSAAVPRPATSVDSSGPQQIIQISSHADRPAAEAAAQTLSGEGFVVHVLNSDDYSPMNRGFYVVYAGPFPATSAGRDAAKRIQTQLPGARLREIRSR